MTVSVYSMLEALSPEALNTLVAAAIADGQQPFGAPFSRVTPHGETSICQAMITGSQVLVGATGDTGADYTAALDTDATMAANSDAVIPTQKAVKTALATKAASTILTTQTIRAAAGVPSGAPTGTEARIAVDTTAVSGGIYYWSGSAWVKAATV